MKEEISNNTITMLNAVKNFLLLDSRNMRLFVINDFTVETETTNHKSLFGEKTITKNFLTSIKIIAYHMDAKFIGTLHDDDCKHMVILYDFYVMRDNWIKFREQLKCFGFDVLWEKKNNQPPAELEAKVFNGL
jgi:hypothetical protein